MLVGGDSSLATIVGEVPDKGQTDLLSECAAYVGYRTYPIFVAFPTNPGFYRSARQGNLSQGRHFLSCTASLSQG